MSIRSDAWSLPNALSAFRLLSVPVLAGLAWAGEAGIFLAGLAAAFGSDVADGWLARRSGRCSKLGAVLDSWGDLALYAALPLCAFWLWPDRMRAEAPWLCVALAAFVLPLAVGFAKFGRLTSYHTWGAKAAGLLMGAGSLALFVGGPSWPFHLATAVLVLEAAEEIAITAVLPGWRSDVRSLRRALRIRESHDRRARGRAARRAAG
jgi:CDP-diacylglycerol--glycerol-3-phosphate 3-phosphatidyltransferase